jgi:hypothetical protein
MIKISPAQLIFKSAGKSTGSKSWVPEIFLLVIYAVVVGYSLVNHSPWRDEADAWVVARSITFPDFLKFFANSGHPPLWYLVQMPFARLGLPFETQACINYFFSICVAALVLFRSPFSIPVRAGVIFSVFIFYQYAVVSRGYMMMVFLFCLYATYYQTRLSRPWRSCGIIALLFNTESFAMVPAGGLFHLFIRDSGFRLATWKRGVGPLALAVGGGLVAVIALWPTGESYTSPMFYLRNNLLNFPHALNLGMFPRNNGEVQPWGFLSAAFLVFLALGLDRNRWRGFLALWLGWVCFIFTFLYGGQPYHFYLIPFFAVLTLWFDAQENIRRTQYSAQPIRGYALAAVLYLALAMSTIAAIRSHLWELRTTFSGGKGMARFIRQNHYENTLIASFSCTFGPVLSAYLPQLRVWHVQMDRYQPYMLWDRVHRKCEQEADQLKIERLVKSKEGTYPLVLTTAPQGMSPTGWELELLHSSPGSMESFYLYRIKAL